MPRLSIVIPWLGPVGPCEETLAAVLQNRPHGSELLVALGQPYSDPYQLSEEVEFLPPSRPSPGLVGLVNHALTKARAPVVHVVPAGYLVDDGWASAALLQFEDQQVAAVAPVILKPQQKERVVAAGLDYQPGGARQPAQGGSNYDVARLVQTRPLGAPLAGGFFRKSVLDLLGGFDPQCGDCLADVDLALSLQQLGLRTECEPTSVLWQASAMQESRGRFSDGLQAERLYRKHFASFDPKVAQTGHRRQVLGELLWSLCQPWWLAHLAGRALGMLSSPAAAQAAKIADAKERLTLEQELPQVLRMPTRGEPATNPKLRRAA